ncbi:MAG: O-methyltransferase [Candidatus Zhuqueibacterota bacterium]
MEIVNSQIEAYIRELVPIGNPVLKEMEAYGMERKFPIIGPLCGQFLRQMAAVSQANAIFEMGSGFGYSAVWFAMGMARRGKIICTDGDEKNRDRALAYFDRLGIRDSVEFHVGHAQDILRKYDGPFDIIFNDVDKEQYPDTIDLALSRLRKGGLFITDNALWDGEVLRASGDKYTEGVKEFNRLLFARNDCVTLIVPLRDGLAVSVKL